MARATTVTSGTAASAASARCRSFRREPRSRPRTARPTARATATPYHRDATAATTSTTRSDRGRDAMDDARSNQYLTFFVADEEFGVSILEAREITQYTTVTKVPAMPAAIRGVINLRGRVVPVIDLALRFELGPQPVTPWTCVLIVDAAAYSHGTGLIGLIVDRVSQVVELPAGEIELPPDFGTRVQ